MSLQCEAQTVESLTVVSFSVLQETPFSDPWPEPHSSSSYVVFMFLVFLVFLFRHTVLCPLFCASILSFRTDHPRLASFGSTSSYFPSRLQLK